MARRIHLSILSDSRLVREALAFQLAQEEEIELIGAADTVHQLLADPRARRIDVLLAYTAAGRPGRAETAWDVKTLLPAARVIVFGSEQNPAEIVRWIEAGASACLEDETPYRVLLETIRGVAQGRTACSSGVLHCVIRRIAELSEAPPPRLHREPLTDREAEVARMVAAGLINKQIARSLGIKPPTVKTHIHNILKKLHLERREDVIRLARTQWNGERGIDPMDPSGRC